MPGPRGRAFALGKLRMCEQLKVPPPAHSRCQHLGDTHIISDEQQPNGPASGARCGRLVHIRAWDPANTSNSGSRLDSGPASGEAGAPARREAHCTGPARWAVEPASAGQPQTSGQPMGR